MANIKRDTSKSERIVQRFRQRSFKARRKRVKFSGTWETTVEELFPLFCPAREADWIPGWDCDLIYTESGYVEDNCVFRTGKSNPAGDGLWIFTGFEVNRYVQFVRVQEDMVLSARITVSDNNDGTVTATWNVLHTGLTEEGNEKIASLEENHLQGRALVRMIDHYLKKGKTINRASLAMGVITHHVAQHMKER